MVEIDKEELIERMLTAFYSANSPREFAKEALDEIQKTHTLVPNEEYKELKENAWMYDEVYT